MILSLWNEGEKPALVFSGVFFLKSLLMYCTAATIIFTHPG